MNITDSIIKKFEDKGYTLDTINLEDRCVNIKIYSDLWYLRVPYGDYYGAFYGCEERSQNLNMLSRILPDMLVQTFEAILAEP